MSLFGENIDLSKVETRKDFDAIPEGEYFFQCIDAEKKTTKSGGKMIEVQLKVVGGQFDNRRVFHRFNIVNQSEKAQTIGLEDLKRFLIACGVDTSKPISSLESILGLVCRATVVHKQDPTYGLQVNLKRWATEVDERAETTEEKPKAKTEKRARTF